LDLSDTSAVPFRGLLVIGVSLHIAYQALLFAELLETPYHLLNVLAGSRLDLEHIKPFRNDKTKNLEYTTI